MSGVPLRTPRDLEEQEARIRLLQADMMVKTLDALKRHQDSRFGVAQVLFTAVAAVAAMFGAAVALVKWVGG